MKQLRSAILLAGSLACGVAHADTIRDFVRIACVPAAGLLDVQYRSLHDSVAGDRAIGGGRAALLAREGFHAPRGLDLTCGLGPVAYRITADQAPASNARCGGSPEVYLTVRRNGAALLSGVVFGPSCRQSPSVTRITIGDGPQSWRGRETQLCRTSGKDGDPEECDWTSGSPDAFGRRYPVDQERLTRIATGQERR